MIASILFVGDVYMQKKPKVCLSFSSDKKYLPYLEKALYTLNKNSPNCFAFVDLINCTTNKEFNNTTFIHTTIDTANKKPIKKCIDPSHLKELVVPYTGAYANLRKVYNIYYILQNFDFDYVINMDSDNLILKDFLNFEELYNDDFDMLIRYRDEPLFGKELLRRKESFKLFDLTKLDLENQDRRFREGCFVARNNSTTHEFFKIVYDNILDTVEWYGDSYWILRAFQQLKNKIKIKQLSSVFVAYDLVNELHKTETYVCSGHYKNKHSDIYKKLFNEL